MLHHKSAILTGVFFALIYSANSLAQSIDQTKNQSRASNSYHHLKQLAELAQQEHRPTIGLVLSGGGARGAAHIGVLKVLEELQIPIDVITGTSMGAVVGGLYASGYNAKQLEKIIEGMNWAEMFTDHPQRSDLSFRQKRLDDDILLAFELGLQGTKIRLPKGLVQGQNLDLKLRTLFLPVNDIHNFDNLPIPFRAVATNIETDEPVVFSSGNIATAVRASMSIPGLLTPTEVNGQYLVDGGVTNNLPTQLARELGAEILIVVDITSPLLQGNEVQSLGGTLYQLSSLLTTRSVKEQLKYLEPNDILLIPALNGIETTSFKRSAEAIDSGEEEARKHLTKLKALSADKETYEKFKTRHQLPSLPKIYFIEINDTSKLSDKIISSKVKTQIGETVDPEVLNEDIALIYALDVYESVSFDTIEKDTPKGEETGLEITTKEKSWGPNYLRFGLALENDFNGNSYYAIAARYTMSLINSLGGQWRVEGKLGNESLLATELFQPLDYNQKYFVTPRIEYDWRFLQIYNNTSPSGEYQIRTTSLRLTGGRELANWGEIRTGAEYRKGRVGIYISDPMLEEPHDFENGLLFAGFGIDTLDKKNFPHTGERVEFEWLGTSEGLGDESYQMVEAEAESVHTWRRGTLTFRGRTGLTFDGELPIQDIQTLGGFLNLSGYSRDELIGQNLALGNVIYYHRVGQPTSNPLNITFYIGGSVEAGNIYAERSDISIDDLKYSGSIFVGADTRIGPIYFAYGFAGEENNALYLFIGSSW